MKKTNLLNIVNQVNLKGGITYNLETGEVNPVHGYMVAIPGHERTLSHIDKENLAKYIKQNADVLYKEGMYLGIWKDVSGYVVDTSELIDNKAEAVELGVRREQKAIWDNRNIDQIDLPEPQRAGTETQKREYARIVGKQMTKSLH